MVFLPSVFSFFFSLNRFSVNRLNLLCEKQRNYFVLFSLITEYDIVNLDKIGSIFECHHMMSLKAKKDQFAINPEYTFGVSRYSAYSDTVQGRIAIQKHIQVQQGNIHRGNVLKYDTKKYPNTGE